MDANQNSSIKSGKEEVDDDLPEDYQSPNDSSPFGNSFQDPMAHPSQWNGPQGQNQNQGSPFSSPLYPSSSFGQYQTPMHNNNNNNYQQQMIPQVRPSFINYFLPQIRGILDLIWSPVRNFWKSMSWQQKVAVAALAGFGLFTVGFIETLEHNLDELVQEKNKEKIQKVDPQTAEEDDAWKKRDKVKVASLLKLFHVSENSDFEEVLMKATHLKQEGRYDEAEILFLFLRNVSLKKRTGLESEDYDMFWALIGYPLALTYKEAEKFEKSKIELIKVLNSFQRLLNSTSDTLTKTSLSHIKMQRFDATDKLLEVLVLLNQLEEAEKWLNDFAKLQNEKFEQAKVAFSKNPHDEANIKNLHEARKDQGRLFDHTSRLKWKKGEYQEAAQVGERALKYLLSETRASDHETLRSQLRLGQIYFDMKQPEEGQIRFDSLIERVIKEDGEKCYTLPFLLLYIAQCNFNCGRYDLAEKILLETKEKVEETKSEKYDEVLLDIINSIATLYHATDNLQLFRKYDKIFATSVQHADIQIPNTNSRYLLTKKVCFIDATNLKYSLELLVKKESPPPSSAELTIRWIHPSTARIFQSTERLSKIYAEKKPTREGHELKLESPPLDLSLEETKELKPRRFVIVVSVILDPENHPEKEDSIHKQWVDLSQFNSTG